MNARKDTTSELQSEEQKSEMEQTVWFPTSIELTQTYEMTAPSQLTSDYPAVFYRGDTKNYIAGYVPYHWHETIELVMVLEGIVSVTVNGRLFQLERGDGLLVNRNVPHIYKSSSLVDGTVRAGCLFLPTFIAERDSFIYKRYVEPLAGNKLYPYILLRKNVPWCAEITQGMRDFCDKATTSLLTAPALDLLDLVVAAWKQIFLHLDEIPHTGQDDPSLANSQMRVKAMCGYISEHYHEDISLDDLAGAAAISRSEVSRSFEKSLSITPGNYLCNYRVLQACFMLSNTDYPIVDIATACGFNSASYFSKTFKQAFDISPKNFRKYISM